MVTTRSMASSMFNVPVSSMSIPRALSEESVNTDLWSGLGDFVPSTANETMLCKCISSLLEEVKFMNRKVSDLSLKVEDMAKDQVVIEQTAAKAEQYHRRDTVIVAGMDMPANETPDQLKKAVSEVLNKSGTTVWVENFSAVHRNGKEYKTIKKGDKEIQIPPSITVKFSNLNKKDEVLRSYKNFDSTSKKRRKICVYQSLSPYYKLLKDEINKYCTSKGLAIAWAHWRSPTCGIAVKLKGSGILVTNVHGLEDFTSKV